MVRYFFLSLNVLNSLLVLAVVAVAYFAVIPLWNPVARISLPAVTGAVTSPGEQTTPSQRSPVTDYAVISDKNLFHPERKLPLEKQPEKAIPKPDVVLYGTLIGDDASYAFIEDKKASYSTPGRGKRQITLKKRDHLSGYIVSEIEANRIVLVKGEEKVVVMLDDGTKRRTGEVPAGPTAARTTAVDTSTASSQAMPPSLPAVVSPVPGIAPPGSRPTSQSLAPSISPAVPWPDPGSGLSTRSGRVQEVQKIKAERQMSPGGSPDN